MRILIVAFTVAGLSTAVFAAPMFHDDFENGMSNWSKWPGAAETLQWTADKWKSIDPGPVGVHEGHAARQHAYVGGGNGYASYHDFGARSGPIRAEVYMFEDYTSTQNPIFGSLQLVGADNGQVGFNTDYHQLGIIQWAGTNTAYSSRTMADGFAVSNVARKSGFTKLAIEADGPGQPVRFYVDDQLVRTSTQSAPLQYVVIGFNASNYENFWYDGVRVVPEPATAALLMLGLGFAVTRKRR